MTLLNAASLIEPERVVHPPGWVGHIPFASWIIALLRPALFVELGTHSGNSYAAFCQAIARERITARAYAIDTWAGDEHAGLYDDSVFLGLQAYHDPKYGSFSTLLRKSFDEAVTRFSDGSIDLLHIDGLHTYEAVKHDFETWLPKLSAKAVVLLHDTCVHTSTFGVHQLWDELTQDYPGFNFKHSHGLGVLLVGSERNPELLALALDDDNDEWRTASDFFRILGSSVERRARIDTLEQAVGERDAQLAALNQSIASMAAETTALTGTIAAQGCEATRLQHALGELEQRVAELNDVVAARDQHAASLVNALAERDSAITELEQVASAREQQAVDLQSNMAERDSAIAGLQQTVATQEQQLADLRSKLAEMELHGVALSEMVVSRDSQVASLNEAIVIRDKQIESHLEDAAHINEQLVAITGRASEAQQEVANLRRLLAERETLIREVTAVQHDYEAEIAVLREKQANFESELLRYQSHWVFRVLSHPQRKVLSITQG